MINSRAADKSTKSADDGKVRQPKNTDNNFKNKTTTNIP